jgi:phospholipid-binding lipoprotein MlaA
MGNSYGCALARVATLIVVLTLVLPIARRAAHAADSEDALDTMEAEFDAEYASRPDSFPDPLENMNRKILGFNRTVDHWFLNPIADAYGFIVPEPAQRCVQRFLSNLDSPSVMVNDLLQLEWKDAGVTATRFFVNTTVGVGGLFDPATTNGLPGHKSDFGQTLALMGIPSGAYLMLPIAGPVTVRDGTGYIVDLFFQPTTWVLGPASQLVFNSIHGGSSGIVLREAQSANLRALEESSIDYYAALRNAFYQNRMLQIWSRRQHRQPVDAEPGNESTPSELAKPSGTTPATI